MNRSKIDTGKVGLCVIIFEPKPNLAFALIYEAESGRKYLSECCTAEKIRDGLK